MKHLHLLLLKLRIWVLRRHLRKMGFRQMAAQIAPGALLQLLKKEDQQLVRQGTKLGFAAALVLMIGLIVWLRTLEPHQTVAPVKAEVPTIKPDPSENSHRYAV